MDLLSVAGVPTYVFAVFAVVAGLALVGRSWQIVTGENRVSLSISTLMGLGAAAVGGMTFRAESGRRVAEILVLVAISYIAPSIGALDELREEYLAQKDGGRPGPAAARFFYKMCGIAAGLTVLAVVFVRGW